MEKSDNISHGKPSAGLNPLKASQSSDSAKISTNVEITKTKLKDLADKWKGINSVCGFLTELWITLGIAVTKKGRHKGGNASRYAAFRIKKDIIVTIRASAHNADAHNYSKEGNIDGDCNLSIVTNRLFDRWTIRRHNRCCYSPQIPSKDAVKWIALICREL